MRQSSLSGVLIELGVDGRKNTEQLTFRELVGELKAAGHPPIKSATPEAFAWTFSNGTEPAAKKGGDALLVNALEMVMGKGEYVRSKHGPMTADSGVRLCQGEGHEGSHLPVRCARGA